MRTIPGRRGRPASSGDREKQTGGVDISTYKLTKAAEHEQRLEWECESLEEDATKLERELNS